MPVILLLCYILLGSFISPAIQSSDTPNAQNEVILWIILWPVVGIIAIANVLYTLYQKIRENL